MLNKFQMVNIIDRNLILLEEIYDSVRTVLAKEVEKDAAFDNPITNDLMEDLNKMRHIRADFIFIRSRSNNEVNHE